MTELIEYVEQGGQHERVRRPFLVPDSLHELTGPTTGTVTLPVTLDWTPKRTYDLGKDWDIESLYSLVLAEAYESKHLSGYLNRDILIRIWTNVRIPAIVKAEWEKRFSELAPDVAR